MAYEISVDQERCIGCGTCVGICDNFELVEGKSKPKQTKVEEVGCNKQAEQMCPVHAITVKEV